MLATLVLATFRQSKMGQGPAGFLRGSYWIVGSGEVGQNQGYLINGTLPGLIKAGKNPTLRLLGRDGRELA